MCILFIKLLKSAKPGEFKLILASNRDEFFKRPGKSAHFWEEDGNIIGGRDMTENKQGGTWLAMSKKGKLGVLLNVLERDRNPSKLGRGFLVADYLKSTVSDTQYLETVMENGQQYNKFHLVTAFLGCVTVKYMGWPVRFRPQPSLFHCSNAGKTPGISQIQSEVFAVGNSHLQAPFQKVIKGKERFEEICSKYGSVGQKEELIEQLLTLLKWEEKHYPDDVLDEAADLPQQLKQNYSAVFVKLSDSCYGTRAHTIILVDGEGNVEFHEWALGEPITPEHMEWKKTSEKFCLQTDTSL